MLDEKYSKYLPKENKSYVIANAILESICYHNKINKHLAVSTFDKTTGFYNWDDENTEILDIMENSKNILKEATRVIRALKILVSEKRKYMLSTEEWFDDTKFSIHDNIVLKELSQILLYYVGNCRGMTYSDFFKKLDFLIEYVIKPATEHNESFEKERYIIDCINSFEEVLILDENNNEVFVVAVKIKLSRASYNNKVDKILVFESAENSSIQEISIDRVVLKEKKQLSTIKNSISQNIKTKTISNAVYKSKSINNEVDTNIEVILECDSYVYEYFQMKPLKNMRVFDSNEIKMAEYYFDTKEDKFYIVAKDKEEMILSTVLHCLPYAVVLNNDDLNEKLIQKFKDYSKKASIELCPPPAPNEPSPNSNDEPKKEEKQNSTAKPKSQLSKEEQEKLNKLERDINKHRFD